MITKVGRNDPCPCGSGKKYKKCCMKKDNVVQLQEVKEERFAQQKLNMVNQLNDFILDKLSINAYHPLEAEFKKRANSGLGGNQRGFFNFWLYFFHRYDNGLRGIEWFLAENEQRLSPEEKQMAERWVRMKPKMIEAIDSNEKEAIFREQLSGETFNLPITKENLPQVFPWHGTLALLEPVDDSYYFNGVRSLVSPKQFYHAVNFIRDLKTENGADLEQVLLEYYPEILGALVNGPETEERAKQEKVTYTYMFLLNDKDEAERFLYNDEDFGIDEWGVTHKRLTWLSNVQEYSDSEINGKVHLSEVNATLEIENKSLTFTTTDRETVDAFLRKVEKTNGAISYAENFEQRFMLPVQIDSKQLAISSDEGVPEYIALYAHHYLHTDVDKKIPVYDNQSLRELVSAGQVELAEQWLKQAENDMHRMVHERYGAVDITPDFNTVRKELGLPLSPFVTGGENRHTSIRPVSPEPREHVVSEADIPIYEKLGFTADTVNAFYVKDIVACYKEKTDGKSEGTERKYRNSLFDIREALEARDKQSWEACDLAFWRDLLLVDFFALNKEVSKSMIKDMVTTVKALTKWLANEGKLTIDKQVAAAAKDYQMEMLEIYETEYEHK